MIGAGDRIDAADGDAAAPPARISLNFADRCNLTCGFCYIPFDGLEVDPATAAKVVDVILQWNPTNVTIGGGDPLMYSYLTDLLRQMRLMTNPPFVQLDTNLLGSSPARIRELRPLIDMVGVPLDSLEPQIARVMRGDLRHPSRLMRLLPTMIDQGACVKINTLVATPNSAGLQDLADFISKTGPRIWSLYEFWAVGERARRNDRLFAIDHESFRKLTHDLASRVPGVEVEIGSVRTRRSSYFFITPNGRAYTVDSRSPWDYVELGNILREEKAVLRRWHKYANPASNASRATQRKVIATVDQLPSS